MMNDLESLLKRINPKIKNINDRYNYNDELKKLMYLIIPSFIIKYGYKLENEIIECFNSIPIVISNKVDKNVMAYFKRTLDTNFNIHKMVVLNNYNSISEVKLLDSLIHEFNHAINSYKKELKIDDNMIVLRSGLSSVYYDKNNLERKAILKNLYLEEVINTIQTEQILQILSKTFNYNIYNYQSNAYLLQTTICKKLTLNKTFISTLSDLRFKGDIDDISYWFDSITNIKGSFDELSSLLDDTLNLEKTMTKNKLKNRLIINKIKKKIEKVLKIVDIFDKNTIYK